MAAEGWEQAVAWAAALGAWAVALQMTEYSVHCGILKCPCRLGQELLMCWQEQHPRSGRPAWCSACSMNINSMRSCVCTYNRNTSGGLDALMHLQTVAWLCLSDPGAAQAWPVRGMLTFIGLAYVCG